MAEPKKRRSRNSIKASEKSLSHNKSEQEVIVEDEQPQVIDYSINIEDRVTQSYYDFLLSRIVTKFTILGNNKKTLNTVSSEVSVTSASPCGGVEVIFTNGNSYYGELLNNRLNGNGIYRWPDGTLCECKFINNKLEGNGTIMYSDESSYSGYICCGYRHINGTFLNEIYSYSGEYKNAICHGHGILISKGQKFDGYWENGIRIKGTRFYNNEIFVGELDENEEKKNGSYYFINGDIYKGNWLDNMFSGYGKYTWNGNFNSGRLNNPVIGRIFDNYEGYWKENKRHGQGVLTFGEKKIIAIWRENFKNGPGILFGENGNVFVSPNLYQMDKYCFSRHVQITNRTTDLIKSFITIPNCFELDDRFLLTFKDAMDECDACFCVQKRTSEIFDESTDNIKQREEGKGDYVPTPEPDIDENHCIGCIANELKEINEKLMLTHILYLYSNFGEFIEANIYPILIPCHHINLLNTPILNFISGLYPNAKYEDLFFMEIKSIQQMLIDNIEIISSVYDKYARLCNDGKLNFKPIMNLMTLWQFSRDILLHKRGINIYQTIYDADHEFNLLIVNYNDPFELIFFWQFIKYLLYITMLLNQDKNIKSYSMSSRPKCFGQFCTMFLMCFRDFIATATPFSTGFLPTILLNNEMYFHNFMEHYQHLITPLSLRNVLQFLYGFKVKRINATIRESSFQFNCLYELIDSLTQMLKENQCEQTNTDNKSFFKSITFQDCLKIAGSIFPKLYKNNLVVQSEFNMTGLEFFEIIIKLIEKEVYNEKYLAKRQQLIDEKLEEIAREEEALRLAKGKGGKKKKKY